jgi:MFS family permease
MGEAPVKKSTLIVASLKIVLEKCRLYAEKWHNYLALLLFILILIVFRYASLVNSSPQSTHIWRQSDCASIALNYYQDGMRFFQPEIHNLHADEGTTGHSVSESPFLYYTVAGLYQIFGYNHWVYRGLWTIILIFGFFSLYRFFCFFAESKVHSLLGALLIFSSPVLIFYGNSFLPDVPAFALTLAGWMVFAKWIKERKTGLLYLVAFLFMLGGMLKVTALLSFFSLAGLWFLELFGARTGKNNSRVFTEIWKSVLPFIIAFVIVVAWYIWAWRFNEMHDTKYFSMRTCPIWNLSSCIVGSLSDVTLHIRELWMPHLLNKPMQVFLSLCAVFIILFIRKANRMLLLLTTFTFVGSLFFILIWFAAFRDHDYYFINLYIFPVFLVITSIELAAKHFRKSLHSPLTVLFMVGLTLYGIFYTSGKQRLRYNGWMNNRYNQFADIRSVAPLIEQLGIEPEDIIVSIPDETSGYTLYILNRRGYTLFFDQAADSLSLANCIDKDARFMFITDYPNTIKDKPYLKYFIDEPVGIYNNLQIFRIDGEQHHKKLHQFVDTLFYHAIYAGELYKSDSSRLAVGNFVLDLEEHSDSSLNIVNRRRSLLLNENEQFGFTTTIPVYPNSTFKASVWKKSVPGKGELVVSSKRPDQFYHSVDEGVISSDTGWELYEINLRFDSKSPLDELLVYVWNPDGEDVLFDKLQILITRDVPEIISVNCDQSDF